MLAFQIRHYLRAKNILLLLDNMEHLTDGVAFLVDLLRDASGLKLLVTSHERLRLHGEWLVTLEGLSFPAQISTLDETNGGALLPQELDAAATLEHYSAMQLFAQATRAYTPNFELTPTVAPAVAQICRLVAGLPLGIELAASWTRLLSCTEVAAEIAQSLDFLADSSPHLPSRQQRHAGGARAFLEPVDGARAAGLAPAGGLSWQLHARGRHRRDRVERRTRGDRCSRWRLAAACAAHHPQCAGIAGG